MKIILTIFFLLHFSLIGNAQTFMNYYENNYSSGWIAEKDDSTFILLYDPSNFPVNFNFMSLSDRGDSLTSVPYYLINQDLSHIIRSYNNEYLVLVERYGLARMSSTFDTLWVKPIPASGNVFTELIETVDSNIVVSSEYYLPTPIIDYVKISYLDYEGDLQWETPPLYGTYLKIAVRDSFIYATYNNMDSVHLICLNRFTGMMNWDKSYDYDQWRRYTIRSISVSDSGIYMAGQVNLDTIFESYPPQIIMKFDLNGDSIWLKNIGLGRFSKMISANGTDQTWLGLRNDSLIISKYNSDGDAMWENNLGYFPWACPMDLIQTSDNGFALTCFMIDDVDLLVVKTDSLGHVDLSTSVVEIKKPSIKFQYDNLNKIVRIESEEGLKNLKAIIYSLDGKMISETEITQGENTISIPKLRNGEYLLMIFDSKGNKWDYKFVYLD